ncbi:MAG: hypothetical protein JO306_09935, partial [Gemmatimonadetes bacterium]|nr:hypothetical protein [Gemmatimonadota bacterium]
LACAALALAATRSADAQERGAGCRRVDAHARDSIAYMQPSIPYGAEYRCRLRAAGPVVRVFVDVDRGDGAGLPTAIRVYPSGPARGPLQVLPLDANSRPVGGGDPMDARDWNGDGWLDLAVNTDWGSAGIIYTVLTWQPRTHRFVADTAVATLANPERVRGRPCIRWFWSGGMAGEDYTKGTTCWTGRRWFHERIEHSDELYTGRGTPRDLRFVHTLRVRRGGRMVVARVDTVRSSH